MEDNLAALGILEEENEVQDEAVKAARESVRRTVNQYKIRTVSYLNVITIQTIALADEVTAIQIHSRRIAAAVLLIQAVGSHSLSRALHGHAARQRHAPAPDADQHQVVHALVALDDLVRDARHDAAQAVGFDDLGFFLERHASSASERESRVGPVGGGRSQRRPGPPRRAAT